MLRIPDLLHSLAIRHFVLFLVFTGSNNVVFALQAKKQSYKLEKKRVARVISSALKDPAIIILQSWLKVRGSLKGWAKFWCVVKPGLLVLYKSSKVSH